MAGGWETWTWDPSLFAGAASYYERGRLPYAPGLAAALGTALDLDGRGRLLDAGCGPGTITMLLAPLFDEAIGLDPDADMLAEAARAVTFAASFHWMDRPRVAAAVRAMLDPGGALVHVDNRHQADAGPPSEHPPVPWPAIDELRRAWLGADRRAGAGIRSSSPGDEDDVLRAAGFVDPEVIVVPDGRTLVRTADDVVASVFSLSGTAPHLFGARAGEFEGELRRLLDAARGGGPGFGVGLPDNLLKLWRPAGPPSRS